MCILAEKQSQNSRFGCYKPSLVKLYLFANEKMSIRFDIFSFAFDILSLSFVIPEGPAFAQRARNERIPGAADPAGSLLPECQVRAKQFL